MLWLADAVHCGHCCGLGMDALEINAFEIG